MNETARQLRDTIKAHGFDKRDPRMAQLCLRCEMGQIDEQYGETLQRWLRKRIEEHEARPVFLPRAPRLPEIYPHGPPDLIMGRAIEGEQVPIGINLEGPVFCAFAGSPGGGKTIAMRRFISAVMEHNERHPDCFVSLVICDRKGEDYADIPDLYGAPWLHFSVDDGLRLGLNAPVGVPADRWISHVTQVFCARASLQFSWGMMADMIRLLLPILNADKQEMRLWTDFAMLLDLAGSFSLTSFASKQEYGRSMIQRLGDIARSTGRLFQSFNGLDVLRDIADQRRHAVISMPAMSPSWIRQFVQELLLSQAHLGRVFRGERNDRASLVYVVDESDADVSLRAEAAYADGMSQFSRTLREAREFGIGILLGLGSLHQVSEHILNALTYHFMFKMTSPLCIPRAAHILHLPRRGDELLPALRPNEGECIARLHGEWSKPILVKIDEVPPSRIHVTEFDRNEHVPSVPLASMAHVMEELKRRLSRENCERARGAKTKRKLLSKSAHEILRLAAEYPCMPLNRLSLALATKVSDAQLKTVREELIGLKFAEFERIRIGRRHLWLVELTSLGWAFLNKSVQKIPGRGDLPHRCIAHWILLTGRKQLYEASLEKIIPGTNHPCDLAWIKGKWQCFEVVVHCATNLDSHLRSCFSADIVDTVTIVSTQKATLSELKAKVEAEPSLAGFMSRTRFETAERYLEVFYEGC